MVITPEFIVKDGKPFSLLSSLVRLCYEASGFVSGAFEPGLLNLHQTVNHQILERL